MAFGMTCAVLLGLTALLKVYIPSRTQRCHPLRRCLGRAHDHVGSGAPHIQSSAKDQGAFGFVMPMSHEIVQLPRCVQALQSWRDIPGRLRVPCHALLHCDPLSLPGMCAGHLEHAVLLAPGPHRLQTPCRHYMLRVQEVAPDEPARHVRARARRRANSHGYRCGPSALTTTIRLTSHLRQIVIQ